MSGSGIEEILMWIVIGTLFLVLPAFFVVHNIRALYRAVKSQEQTKKNLIWERLSVGVSIIYSWLFLGLTDITSADWEEVLVNSQVHSPLWSGGIGTILVLTLLALGGYFVLSAIKLTRLSPLVIVCSMAAMYIGMILSVVWTIQVIFMEENTWVLCIAPFNCIIIALKTICVKMREWNEEQGKREFVGKVKWMSKLNQRLSDAQKWPLVALIAMLPLLGIVIGILVLFGQEPDAVIKAWTETSQWRLSQKVSPQNIIVDEHYLCTVAAGGHRKIVKPIRMGERHGHPVIVNRQLCVANAFEQILEERTPNFHRHVRNFYDTYGFPVAKMIRSRLAADVIYILMKPLEWIFLAVIYTFDVKPENRIAVQYLPRRGK